MSETTAINEQETEDMNIETDFNLNLYAPETGEEEKMKSNEKIAIFFLNTYSILIDVDENSAQNLLVATHPYIIFLSNIIASKIVEDVSVTENTSNEKLLDLKNRIQPNLIAKLEELFGKPTDNEK